MRVNVASITGVIISTFMFLFVIYASLHAPIPVGALGQGEIQLAGDKVEIRSPIDGIIKHSNAKNAAVFTEGSVIIEYDDTDISTRERKLQNQLSYLLSEKYRHSIILQFLSDITIDVTIKDIEPDHLSSSQASASSLLKDIEANYTLYSNEKKMMLRQQKSSQTLLSHTLSEYDLLEEKLQTETQLSVKKLITKNQLTATQLQKIQIEGRLSEIRKEIERLSDGIQQVEQKKIAYQQKLESETLDQLRRIDANVVDITTQLEELKIEKIAHKIISPASGTYISTENFQKGSWLSRGERLGYIVPKDAPLTITAKFRAKDAEMIKVGHKVEITPIGINTRHNGNMEGVVLSISEDTIEEQRSQHTETFYYSEISFDEAMFANKYSTSAKPGLPLQVITVSSKISLFNYILAPIITSMNKSFID